MAKGDGNQYFKNGIKNLTVEERFLQKIKVNESTSCWEWQAFKNKKGYGHFKHEKEILAHRVSYILYIGLIADGMMVCHRCDNPSCVNPNHFFLGTNKDNINDAQSKGRLPTANHPSSVSYKMGCRCELCRRFLNRTNQLSELKRKGVFSGEKFLKIQKDIDILKELAKPVNSQMRK